MSFRKLFFSSNSHHAAHHAHRQTVLKPSSSPSRSDSQSEGFVLPVRAGRTTISHDVYVIQSGTPDYYYFCRIASPHSAPLGQRKRGVEPQCYCPPAGLLAFFILSFLRCQGCKVLSVRWYRHRGCARSFLHARWLHQTRCGYMTNRLWQAPSVRSLQ